MLLHSRSVSAKDHRLQEENGCLNQQGNGGNPLRLAEKFDKRLHRCGHAEILAYLCSFRTAVLTDRGWIAHSQITARRNPVLYPSELRSSDGFTFAPVRLELTASSFKASAES